MLNRCIVRETNMGSSIALEHEPAFYIGQERVPHLFPKRPQSGDELFDKPKALLAVCQHCSCIFLQAVIPPSRPLRTA